MITVCGLGPGSPELLTEETARLLASAPTVILRTRRHPTVAALAGSDRWRDCDDLYAAAPDFRVAYQQMVDRVLAAAATGDVVYAVPGHPLMAERSVTLLLEAAAAQGADVRALAAVSFADVASVALRRDLRDVQLCDAADLRIDPRRPALISQIWGRAEASALKLALLDLYPVEHRVALLHALGSASEGVSEVELASLDHRPTGYLDSVFVPPIEAVEDVRRLEGVAGIVRSLHAPGGCPWDREQTHTSLRHHLLEESYEVLEAIDAGDPTALAEELGDLLLQVLMHAEVADREGTFSLGDIAERVGRKLVHRHPHVFAQAEAGTAEQVYQNWDALKRAEKPRDSILDGVPVSLPALAASDSMQARARRAGFDWPGMDGPLEKLAEEIAEFARAEGPKDREDEFGDILFVIAGIAGRLGIDAEQALRVANTKFRRRFGTLERIARERGLELGDPALPALELWAAAKAALSHD
ncbi:MAG: nucleoside triphosphate pyrophosphohydrolase [Dehalococcoidia bacterium]